MSSKSAPYSFSPFAIRLTRRPAIFRCERGWSWSRESLPDFDLWWAIEGYGKLRLKRVDHTVRPNTCFLLLPGVPLQCTHDDERRLTVFGAHFEMDSARRRLLLPAALSPLTQGLAVRNTAWLRQLADRSMACYGRGDALGKEQARQCVQLMLLHLLEEATLPRLSEVDARVLATVQSIEHDPGATWYLNDLAKNACLSRAQFTRRFAALTGKSPIQFVIHTRLERARQLIAETDMKLGQVADALGYPDVYFFSRQFTRYFGHPPSGARFRSP